MRILHLWDGFRHKATRNQVGFIELLADHCDLVLYGKKEKNKLAKLKYDPKLTANDLVNELKPDVILLHFCERVKECMPKGLNSVKVPKVMLDVNHWKLTMNSRISSNGYEWYKELGIDLLIQRDYSFTKETGIDALWLPFSASNEFFDNSEVKRENKILFVGSTGDQLYAVRKKARKILINKGLINNQNMVAAGKYPEVARKHKGALSCALSDLHCSVNKTFEYMASGTAVMSPWFYGKESLFGVDECFYEYKDNCSDVEEKAKLLLNDNDLRKYVTEQAYNIVHRYHMHEHRIKDLYTIITEFLSTGKKIEIWR